MKYACVTYQQNPLGSLMSICTTIRCHVRGFSAIGACAKKRDNTVNMIVNSYAFQSSFKVVLKLLQLANTIIFPSSFFFISIIFFLFLLFLLLILRILLISDSVDVNHKYSLMAKQANQTKNTILCVMYIFLIPLV